MKKWANMNNRERLQTAVIYGVFIFYILLLLRILFFSRVSILELFDSQRIINSSINLIPFNSIIEFVFGGSEAAQRFSFANVVGNIAIFIPLGVYFQLFKKDTRVIINLLYIFIVSLAVEIIQGLLGIGTADIDDIILNSLGGCIGILGYKFLFLIFRDEKKVSAAIAILSVLGLPAIIYYLFIIRMRF